MSVVPPSPPCATTRTSVRPLHAHRRRDAGGHRRGVAEQRVDPRDLPRGLGIGRREHLEAAGRVDGDQLAVGRAHRRVDRVARAERLAAALAGAVAGVERVGALHVRPAPQRSFSREQPVADGEGAGLVELDGLHVPWRLLLADLRADGADAAAGSPRRSGRCGAPALSRSSSRLTTSASRSRKVSCSSSSAPASSNSCAQRRARDRAAAQAGDHRVALELDARQRLAHAVGHDAAQADGEALLQHDDALGVLQRLAQRGERERPERADATAPIATPSSRISSTTSFMVPITEPSATTIVSASSVR